MNTLVISIGSNSQDKKEQIDNCISRLKNLFSDTIISDIYETPATNGKDPDYFNAVIYARCPESCENINSTFKQYEKDRGRTKESKQCGKIPIDLDIVIFNNEIIRPKDFEQEYFQIGWQQIKTQEL